MKTIFIASDHAGVDYKKALGLMLKKKHYIVKDLGPFTDASVDYPDFAKKVAEEIKGRPGAKGVLICGTGIGMSMAANKLKGVRAALCYSLETARLSREHNDANILCLGARVTDIKLAKKIVNIWIKTEFKGGERHERRIKKIG